MSPREWVAAYPRDVRAPGLFDATITESRLLASSRMFSSTFGRWLHDCLAGEPSPPVEEVQAVLLRYRSWLIGGMGGLVPAIAAQLEDPSGVEPSAVLLSELVYHRMNAPMGQYWLRLLYPDARPLAQLPPTYAQLASALAAMSLARARDIVLRGAGADYWSNDVAPARSWFTGVLTELDAQVAHLEYLRTRPGTLIFPAPPAFESQVPGSNVDAAAINARRDQVIGLQVKSTASYRGHLYDPARVVVIDGEEHLLGRRALRTTRGSAKRAVAWPGSVHASRFPGFAPTFRA